MKATAWVSTPCLNLGVNPMRVHHGRGEKRVTRHKRLLGKQSYVWTGECRFWVWEAPNRWRVYVSDIQGVSFEVAATFTKKQAQAALDDYLAKMQLTDHDCGHPLLCLEGTAHGRL